MEPWAIAFGVSLLSYAADYAWRHFEGFEQGMRLLRQGNVAQAVELFSRAIKLRARVFDATLMRAHCYTLLERWDDAMADYDALLRMAPYRADLHRARIWCRALGRGEWAAALADLNACIERFPNHIDALDDRAYFHLYLRRGRAAADDVHAVLHARGWIDDRSRLLVLVGHYAYRLMYQEAEARSILVEAAAHWPADAWPWPILKYLQGEISESEALASATTAEERSDVHLSIGLNFAYRDDHVRAVPWLRAVQEEPHSKRYSKVLARAEMQRLLDAVD